MAKKRIDLSEADGLIKPVRKGSARPQSEQQAQTPKPETAQRKPKTGRRRSNRTMQMNMNVSPEFYDRLSTIAESEGKYMVEVLELALDAYEKS